MNHPNQNQLLGGLTAARITDARLKQWHQQGEALLTFENARSFLNATGLVLFTPRPQIAAAAPSFVEATIGATTPSPSLAQQAQARELLARLVAEGLAVPLNLLGLGSVVGQAGDTPDFIASTQVFSYIFTLRGDKGWKQPPQSVGAVRFSNLAIATHEILARRGALNVAELARDLGNEITEAAALRALGELWSHLRVIPLPQLDGRPTQWELATARFNRQIKAGVNAGQPTALSALIALYLGQTIFASEDEVESFLSPLAARSRIRDVVHALLAARELETLAIDGRTLLHIGDGIPASLTEPEISAPAIAASSEIPAEGSPAQEGDVAGSASEAPAEAPPARIRKFVPSRRPAAADLTKARPAKFAARRSDAPPRSNRPPRDGEKSAYKPRPRGEGASDKPPFRPRPSRNGAAPERPSFRPRREGASDKPAFRPRREGAASDRPPFRPRPSRDGAAPERPSFRPRREGASDKPAFRPRREGTSSDRPPFRPRPSREGASSERPSFRPRREGASDKPAFRPRREGAASDRPPFRPRPAREGASSERPSFRPRREGGSDKPAFRPRREGASSDRPPFRPRPARDSSSREKPFESKRPGFKRPFVKREGAGPDRRAAGGGDSRPPRKSFGDRPSFGRKPFGEGSATRRSDARPPKRGDFAGPKKDGRSFSSGDRPARPGKPSSFGKGKPSSFTKGKPSSFGKGKPSSFGKKDGGFGGKKPFGKRPPAKKPRAPRSKSEE